MELENELEGEGKESGKTCKGYGGVTKRDTE